MKKTIWIIGGDLRTPYVIDDLINRGFFVNYTGVKSENKDANLIVPSEVEKSNPEAILFPISGVTQECKIGDVLIDENFFSKKQNVIFFSGIATEYLETMKNKYNLKMIYLNDKPTFNKINSVATAEAVVKLIIDYKKRLFQETKIMVLGYGKSGKEIVDLLIRLGASVVIVARGEDTRIEASTMSKYVTSFEGLDQYLPYIDVIVNTVPSLVVTKKIIQKLRKDVYILDIASLPGGVDFEEASKCGIKADLALKLPSLYAPISSSRALVDTIVKELES